MDSEVISPLQAGWLELLGRYEWQWFCTFTFREKYGKDREAKIDSLPWDQKMKLGMPIPIHPEAADKLFRLWISKLNRHLYGPRWSKKGKGVYWVRALERTKRGIIHFHALLADEKNLNFSASRYQWRNEWYQIGGIAHIEEPASVDHCSRYVSKYVAKEGEIETSPNLPQYVNQMDL